MCNVLLSEDLWAGYRVATARSLCSAWAARKMRCNPAKLMKLESRDFRD